MSNDEFQKMIQMFVELNRLIEKYQKYIDKQDTDCLNPEPILIPDDVYDEICYNLDINEIQLLGIS